MLLAKLMRDWIASLIIIIIVPLESSELEAM